jgi:mRNA interferase HigB
MRLIKESRIREYAKTHSRAASSLQHWRDAVRAADWKSFADVKATFGSADQVTLPRRRVTVTVFNVGGGAFRLITVIHYNRGIVYIRRFLTHAQYSKEDWKNDP